MLFHIAAGRKCDRHSVIIIIIIIIRIFMYRVDKETFHNYFHDNKRGTCNGSCFSISGWCILCSKEWADELFIPFRQLTI